MNSFRSILALPRVIVTGLLLSLSLASFISSTSEIRAQTPSAIGDNPIVFTADEVTNNQELGIIKASGSVEISHNNQVLLADTISYNQRQDMVTASGNVSLLEQSGHVLFAEYMEISGDFKTGIIRDLRIRLADNARIAASGARRTNGTHTEMRNAVYSPCDSCASKPDQPPLWQVKAKKIVHDQKEKLIEYYDAWMEISGVPVVYTPYFSHPDPTVKRKSGFLTPGMGGSTSLGTAVSVPYFYAIAPNKDVTITPTITSKEGLLMAGEYRQRYTNGNLEASGSLTYDSNDELRGHIDSTGRFDIDQKWRWGFDAKRSTDDTYLRRYSFPSSRTLTSRAYVEGFSRRNYLAVDSYAFQGTAVEDDPGQSPLVLPMIEYSSLSDVGKFGARTSFNASSVVMTRSEGTDTRRISVGGGWHLPHIGRLGDVTDFSATVRGDLYHVNNLTRSDSENDYNGFSGRIHPQLKADWRLPLARQHGSVSQIVEPLASVIVSPYGGNDTKIPNEDSIDLEFDDTNLFSANKFTGFDRVESGPRINYGLKWGLVGSKGGHTTVFAGQSYRLKEDDTFAAGSGLEGRLSDFVGRVNISPGSHLDLIYRTRLDKDNLAPKRNEVQMSVGPPALRMSTNYVFFDSQNDAEFSGREEISGAVSAQLDRFWRSSISGRYDLQDDGDLRNIALNLVYECECFTFSTTISRQFYEDRDLRPNDTILFKLTFKTLGDVQTGLSNVGG
ncbi:MAG: LPS-assembly protein LptD [Rhodospirillaceae bacterium]|nr:LPS-assembly protein LptD [Rhodospirillaceae bacterium]MBT4588939.1 LPS-assembly protein LptD [Rhodospirillaceae bacterium]MBT4941275.1 LPS-assembly protein LptD [Rhodospirillaceae bacterium]MBT5941709.1 LPS-assembly protein LptD [Rhodospirillaceae bacterium]MBT7267236.1 LPS-assembly protein LptD [Rhodospirillaceae bacterium]